MVCGMEQPAGEPAVRSGPAGAARRWPVGGWGVAAALGTLAAAYLIAWADRGLVSYDRAVIRPLRLELDVNTAPADELAILPGLGPALAGRIVAHRDTHGPFAGLDALLEVPGIGPATLAGLRPHLRAGASAEAAR